jgi:hypothetical protein
MPKKSKPKKPRPETTPRAQIVSALRRLFLRSRERALCIQKAQYTCAECGAKQSKAKGKEVKVTIHHCSGEIGWDAIEAVVRDELLCSPDLMVCLCKDCHNAAHNNKGK